MKDFIVAENLYLRNSIPLTKESFLRLQKELNGRNIICLKPSEIKYAYITPNGIYTYTEKLRFPKREVRSIITLIKAELRNGYIYAEFDLPSLCVGIPFTIFFMVIGLIVALGILEIFEGVFYQVGGG